MTLSDEQAALFTGKNAAIVATLNADGTAQQSVVWIDLEDGRPAFNTAVGRAKERNLRRDPRISVLVLDGGSIYRYVRVDGVAELDEEGAREHADVLAHKYRGTDFDAPPGQRRVIVRVEVERVTAYGF